MRELFLRMMRSIYYWRRGLTLHLFSVALMEWGVAVHVSAQLCTPVLFPFYIRAYFTSVHLDVVFLSALTRHSMFLCARAGFLGVWSVCVL